jgi:putative spermidine/putrescine transport system permease protein
MSVSAITPPRSGVLRPGALGKTVRRLLVALYLAAIAVFLALPAVLVVVVSFDTANYMQFPPSGLTLKWYQLIFASETMRLAILNSMIVAVVSTLLTVAIGVPAALYIARCRFRGRDALYAFLLSPIAVPWVVFGLALLYLWSAASISRDLTAIIIGHTVMGLPFVIRTCVAVLSGVSPTCELAARTLGARRWQSFIFVTLPMMQSGIVAGAVFCILLSFINVPVPLFLTTSSSVTIQVAVFSYLLSNYDPGVSAVSTIQLLIILLALYVAQRVANLREFFQ